jgi:DNA polymerase family A
MRNMGIVMLRRKKNMIERVSNSYEHALQNVYWDIGNRGIRIDPFLLEDAGRIVDSEIARNLAIASNQWGCIVFVGAENAPPDPDEIDDEDVDSGESPDPADLIGPGGSAVNLNSTKGKYAFLQKLKDLGYNVPKIAKKNSEGDYETNYSAGELALQKMLSENQFNYPGGDPALRAVLKIRELGKLKSSYLGARLLRRGAEFYFLTNYNVAGTLSGRRSSRRHTFGFGNNAQNFPKHSKIAGLFRRCLVARHGNIFLMVDQMQAEDWPVSALSNNTLALADLLNGVDRHSKLASAIFGHRVPAKTDPDWDDVLYDQERYIGKKARHANNYGMNPPRFQDVLAQEAQLTVSVAACKQMLDAVNAADPSVQGVFHKYVKDTLSASRILITPYPFLRERQFLSIRPTDANSPAIKEAYAFIPQSTVGDNTGVSLLHLETEVPLEKREVVQEGHDSIVQDTLDTPENIYERLCRTSVAFDRKIRFYNGIEVQIPLEAEIGYSFNETVKIKTFTLAGVKEAHQKLQDKVRQSNVVQVAVNA